MAHLNSITAAMFSDLSVCSKPHDIAAFNLFNILPQIKDGVLTATSGTAGSGFVSANVVTAVGSGGMGVTAGLFQTIDSAADTGGFIRITNIKEFPAVGTPANIVKVPEYGAKTSKQVQGQADSPSMELTLNFIPSLWAANKLSYSNGTSSAIQVGDGNLYLFRFTLLSAEPEGYCSVTDTISADTDALGGGGIASSVAGSVKNSSYYFLGRFETIEVTPSLTDAVTAKLTITVQSDIRGAYTTQ
jgi:hypothetical protein